jgi:hypothetical protein
MENNWVRVFRTTRPLQAELIKGMLQENDIEAVLLNKQASAFQVGDIELYVEPDDAEDALALIQSSQYEDADNAE